MLDYFKIKYPSVGFFSAFQGQKHQSSNSSSEIKNISNEPLLSTTNTDSNINSNQDIEMVPIGSTPVETQTTSKMTASDLWAQSVNYTARLKKRAIDLCWNNQNDTTKTTSIENGKTTETQPTIPDTDSTDSNCWHTGMDYLQSLVDATVHKAV